MQEGLDVGIATLPEAPLFLVANEFFDALPIRQFVRTGETWRERLMPPFVGNDADRRALAVYLARLGGEQHPCHARSDKTV